MTISFTQIPVDLRSPGQYLEIDASQAVGGLPATPSRMLVIGQRLAGGVVAAETPTLIASAAQAAQAFGRGSLLAQQLAALKLANDQTECWAVALDDLGAGVAATGSIAVTGPASASGTIALLVQGARVAVGATVGDTAATIAAAIAAAINAQPDLIVTAVVGAGAQAATVTLTCRHKGTCGNDVDLRVNYYRGDATPAGVGLAIVAMAGGTGNPDVSALWPLLGDVQYASLILPFVDTATLTSVEAELTSRWSASRMIEGMAYGAFRGSMGQAAALGTSRNSAFVSILPMAAAPMASWQIAAAYGGVIAFNGAIDPARPFQTLGLPGILPPASADCFTRQESELLLHDGMSTYKVDGGGTVLIDRPITTYQTDAYGLPSVAFLDVNTSLTLAYLRYAVRVRIAQKFPRMKLADDGTAFGVGQAIVTPKIIRSEILALFRELEDAAIVEDLDQFKADLVVERDAGDADRVNALIPPNIVNQFRVFAGLVQFRL